jgi:hypothetical protein
MRMIRILQSGEETITDINLLELQMRKPLILQTRKMTRPEESKIGADWIWALIGPTGQTMIFHVQAKKLFTNSNKYESLTNAKKAFNQADQLINTRYAASLGHVKLYPLYVFYNFFQSPILPFNCNCGQLLNPELAGCSFADANIIRKIITASKYHHMDLLLAQYPLRCLICSQPCHSNYPISDDIAVNAFNRIAFVRNEFPSGAVLENIDFSRADYISENPPAFLDIIMNEDSTERFNLSELGIEYLLIMDQRNK